MRTVEKRRRSNGSGTLLNRNGYYLWRHVTVDGETKTITLKTQDGKRITTKADAEKIVSELLRKENESVSEALSLRTTVEVVQKLATLKGLLNRSTVALSDLETAWRNSPRRKQGNELAKTTAIRSFVSWLGLKYPQLANVAELTPIHANEYLSDYWQSGITARSWNVRLNMLSIVFRVVLGKDNDPFSDIQKKRESSESREAFSNEQLIAIQRTLNDPNFHLMHKNEMKCLYVLALYSGLRCGDCCLLRWSSVDLDKKLINVIPQKTQHSSKKTVTIPIAEPLHTALVELQSLRDDSDYVFPKVADRYLRNPDGVSKDTVRLLERSGITTKTDTGTQRARKAVVYSFHSFRHTFASMMANNGISPLVIKDILGHSSVTMTSHYSHISLESKQNALNALFSDDDTSADTSIASVIKTLKTPSMSKLANYLDSTLSPSQKRELLNHLA